MSRMRRIQELLETQLTIRTLEIRDDSVRHAGHVGHGGGAETHLILRIDAVELEGLSRLEQHRRVQQILAEEFQNGLHALTIQVNSPVQNKSI